MKLLRRDFTAPAPGCAWTWELQRGNASLPGKELPGSGVMDMDAAKAGGEAKDACVGFSFARLSGSGGDNPEGYVSFRGKPDGSQIAQDMVDRKSYLKIAAEPTHDVREMLANGADVSARDTGGLTALHHHLLSAPSGGSVGVVVMLLAAAADVNARDDTARATTPLLLGVAAKRADLVRKMIHEAWPPADVDARNSENVCALQLAESSGARAVADVLRKAGASTWSGVEFRLGARTTFCFDSRTPVPS